MRIFHYFSVFFIAGLTRADGIVATNDTTTNELMETQMLSVLNKWREGGVQTHLFPLPSLETVYIDAVDTYFDRNGIKMTISIGDMKLYGLDNFTVEYLKVTNTFDNIRLSVKLFVPALSIFSDNYKLKGRAYYLYPLQGLGKMSASLHKVDASLSVNFANVGDVSMRLDNFELNLGFGSVEVDLENSSWPINQVLNKEGVEILKSLHDDIVNSINSYAVPYANEYLAKITYKEFLDIVTNIGDSSYVISKNIK